MVSPVLPRALDSRKPSDYSQRLKLWFIVAHRLACTNISEHLPDRGELKMPVLAPYLIGVVTAPLVVKIVKPIVRGTVKATVGLALEVKKAAAEAGEEFQDIAAEVSSDKAAEAVMSADVAAKTGRSRAAGGAGLAN
jgi:hypothetical protein